MGPPWTWDLHHIDPPWASVPRGLGSSLIRFPLGVPPGPDPPAPWAQDPHLYGFLPLTGDMTSKSHKWKKAVFEAPGQKYFAIPWCRRRRPPGEKQHFCGLPLTGDMTSKSHSGKRLFLKRQAKNILPSHGAAEGGPLGKNNISAACL